MPDVDTSENVPNSSDEADMASTGRGRQPALTGCPWHDVNEMLQTAGLRPTRQRMALGWLLFGKGARHLTAEMLYEEATHAKGVTGTRLLQLLELRLDNVVYRGGLAMSRDQARQFVTHGHFQVNGRKVDIPSYRVKAGDVVAVRQRSHSVGRIVEAAAFAAGRHIPDWLILEAGELKISVVSEPARGVIDVPVQEQMIVELYSK